MALFYQINFTSERQASSRAKLWAVLFVLACLLGYAGYYANGVWKEAQKPVLQPRLSTCHTLAERLSETLVAWQAAFAAYQKVRPYVEHETQTPPWRVVGVVESLVGVASTGSTAVADCRFLPSRLTVTRGEGITLTGAVTLPERDKTEHRDAVGLLLTAVVSNALASSGLSANAACTCALTWGKAEPDAQDRSLEATLRVTVADPPTRDFPAPPAELAEAVKEVAGWREAVQKCRIATNPARKKELKEVGPLLASLVAGNRQLLGDQYERLKRLAENAVNPLAVTDEISRLANEKTPAEVKTLEAAWRALAFRQWRRERSLDRPELDSTNEKWVLLSDALPKREDFAAGNAKVEEYLHAFANGVLKKHIANEPTFWDRVLEPGISNATAKAISPRPVGKVEVDPKAAGVAFPLWKVEFGEGAGGGTQREAAPALSLDDLKAVLRSMETNSAGTWVSSFTATFDDKLEDPAKRWCAIRRVQLEGRVPCWLGNGGL